MHAGAALRKTAAGDYFSVPKDRKLPDDYPERFGFRLNFGDTTSTAHH
jgi:hypothetical protein